MGVVSESEDILNETKAIETFRAIVNAFLTGINKIEQDTRNLPFSPAGTILLGHHVLVKYQDEVCFIAAPIGRRGGRTSHRGNLLEDKWLMKYDPSKGFSGSLIDLFNLLNKALDGKESLVLERKKVSEMKKDNLKLMKDVMKMVAKRFQKSIPYLKYVYEEAKAFRKAKEISKKRKQAIKIRDSQKEILKNLEKVVEASIS